MYRQRVFLASILIAALIAAGCAGLAGRSSSDRMGRLAVYLTDAPSDDIKEVWVTITGVHVHRDGAWHVLQDFAESPLELDLLQLRFDSVLLGEALLPAGAYTQLRLIVDDSNTAKSYVVHRDGSITYLKVPSGAQTGLKVHHRFVVPADGSVELVLDANILDFVHKAGNSGKYIMNPTAIRVTHREASGIITGQVLGASVDAGEPQPIADRRVTVTVQDDAGQVVAQTLALAEEDGRFQVNAVPAGTYTVIVEAANDGAETVYESQVFQDVVVSPGQETTLNGGDPIVLRPAKSSP